MKYIFIFIGAMTFTFSFSQKNERPYIGGFVTKDSIELKSNYNNFYRFLNVKKGENVASVGASNGYVEIQIAAFVDSVNWALEDIDTARLNSKNFNNVLFYHEKLKGKPITGNFSLIIGTIDKTNLSKKFYDRILLVNTYHELTGRKSILKDIHESLKLNGELIVMERIGTKKGQIHGDCKLAKLFEPDFLDEMKDYGFEMAKKEVPNKRLPLTFYTFKKI